MIDTSILNTSRVIELPGTDEFDLREFFQVGVNSHGVNIGFVGRNIEVPNGRIESNVPPIRLHSSELMSRGESPLIINAYGGDKSNLGYFTYVAQLLIRQPNGEEGVLVTVGRNASFGQITGSNRKGEFGWRVQLLYVNSTWKVDVYEPSHPYEWYAGDRVLFRDPKPLAP